MTLLKHEVTMHHCAFAKECLQALFFSREKHVAVGIA